MTVFVLIIQETGTDLDYHETEQTDCGGAFDSREALDKAIREDARFDWKKVDAATAWSVTGSNAPLVWHATGCKDPEARIDYAFATAYEMVVQS